MGKYSWLLWGFVFSFILFIALYFLIYVKITHNTEPLILMLGNLDVTKIGLFFSKIHNIILVSLIGGFLLGLITINSNKEHQY